MAKNHRPSNPGGSTSTGIVKRGRNQMTGRFLVVKDASKRPSTTVVERTYGTRRPVKELAGAVLQIDELTIRDDRITAVMHAAADEGLTLSKDGRIAGRVSSELIAKAKAKTGITSDTELLEFALANVAVEDKFAEAFHAVRGTVDPDLDFGF